MSTPTALDPVTQILMEAGLTADQLRALWARLMPQVRELDTHENVLRRFAERAEASGFTHDLAVASAYALTALPIPEPYKELVTELTDSLHAATGGVSASEAASMGRRVRAALASGPGAQPVIVDGIAQPASTAVAVREPAGSRPEGF